MGNQIANPKSPIQNRQSKIASPKSPIQNPESISRYPLAYSLTSPMTPPEPDFEQALEDLGRSLQTLQARYAQVKTDQQRQETLQQRIEQAQRDYAHTQDPSLKLELKRLKDQLAELEVALESQLFSWSSLKEPFWMAVRFGGLGVVLGWLLKSLVG